ncbi:c-type cytochrome [Denitromonas halophila]|uniref:C-type cytochrome n=1 Tax=Denitromonas halophila TaxID=1629404 RepID=A0A557QWC5_9RHOO|nr:c-type cytochrome [Denitromonas halophila]TVO57208.1 c-type cytochrome [Denitromonas halophila]
MKQSGHFPGIVRLPRPTVRRLIVSLCVSLWTSTTCFAVAPPADPARAQLAAGKSRFDKLCVSCHGPDGAGKDTYGPKLQHRPELTEAQIRERIIQGKHGDHAMPPWGTVLDGKAIDELVAYVGILRQPAEKQSTAPLSPFDLYDPARIENGRKRFAKTCAGYCHGHEGVGGRAPDFKGRTDLGAQQTFDVIFHGRMGSDVMPPWGDAFSEEKIWELVAYLQHLGRQKLD